tara:strand:+ start:413 stop:640 length:228 start_codon:yes stop_codon:yes gene_type:complete
MCFGGSSAPPPPPPTPSTPVQPDNQEDLTPEIEIAGDEGLSAEEEELNKNKTGSSGLNTSVGTGSISGAGLEIPN